MFIVFALVLLLFSHWSFVSVPLIFLCPPDHVPVWPPRILLGMVEDRSVNVKNVRARTHIVFVSHISTCINSLVSVQKARERHIYWSIKLPE